MIRNQPAFLRSGFRLAATADAQFIQYMTDMCLHCRKLDIHDFTDLRVALIGEIIKARQEKGISQKKLEELSGVKQPIIARMEKGTTSPQIDTILKLLAPLGKTLAVVPLSDGK